MSSPNAPTYPNTPAWSAWPRLRKTTSTSTYPATSTTKRPKTCKTLQATCKAGIPSADVDALQPYWAVCPQLRTSLFQPKRPGYLNLAVGKAHIKTTIYGHPEFTAFVQGMNTLFTQWQSKTARTLKALDVGCHPKQVIAALAEDLLAHYTAKPLMDAYGVYQHLMDYWATTMQDDCYLVAADGWKAETHRIIEKDKKGKEKDKGWACDLVPKALIVARYFAKEQAAIDQLTADLDSTAAQITELEEEHSGDEAVFGGFDKINKASVAERLKEIKGDKDATDEAEVLHTWLKLSATEADMKKRLREAEAALDTAAYAHYPKLTKAEVQTLVVDDKWLATLSTAIHGEMDRISQRLTQRVKELAERYETPMPQMASRVSELEAKVKQHMAKMGFAWN
jgi:type I restriction enzyme M protein